MRFYCNYVCINHALLGVITDPMYLDCNEWWQETMEDLDRSEVGGGAISSGGAGVDFGGIISSEGESGGNGGSAVVE